MKKLILLLFIPLALGCSSFKSGLTIPANQTFILGEFNNKNYSAELINQSELEVMVKVIEIYKRTGSLSKLQKAM